MRLWWLIAGILVAPAGNLCAQVQSSHSQQPIPPAQLVREVVYNELHDHDRHGYWRYWVERRTPKETRREDQVETAGGPITRLSLSNGRAPSVESQQAEQARLNHLLT
jgi:hypothetical protein